MLDEAGYRPQDWDRQTRGQVTMLEAIVQSWNIPAVWLLHEMGIDTGMGFARKLGIPLAEQEDRNLGLALGGLATGVSPLDMAQAYSAFANQGVMHAAHAITKITTRDGHVLVEAAPASSQVMSPATASTMTLMLQQAVARGTGRLAALERPAAGKTGTTELPATEEFAAAVPTSAKDAWLVGYTPDLTAAIWVGYDRTDKDHYLNTAGGSVPAKLFREIMTRSLQGVPVADFVLSAPVQAQVSAQDPNPVQSDQTNKKQSGKSDQGGGHNGKSKKWW
ncbi:penicillin-binding transpeptidase domain-containing protein [Paenibacillus sp. GP183]|uniref:transglycosylase domain-containing protein n=1 Tax=Paenibacillus sp. GP183 TaxID=1882751 RepID=UPI0025B76112|nr:penicillin-binding transpeptidase domain-containing protein [Paenibacillus sp. GP183]